MAVLSISLVLTGCGSHGVVPSATPRPSLAPSATPSPSLAPSATPSPSLAPTATPSGSPFRVVGYVTDAAVPEVIPYDKLTAINFAFLIPNADGSFQPLENAWKLQTIVALAHARGVRVLISVGGWGWDKQFEALAADPATRSLFVAGLVQIVDQYQLDGVDIDWEYPARGDSSDAFLALMRELRQAFPPPKILSAAVAALGQNADGIPTASFSLMDYANLMVYDGDGPNHSSLQFARDALDYWLASRSLPQDKAVLGVPFYARPNGVPYYKIVASDPAAAQVDTFDYGGTLVNYNGIQTMQQKTLLARMRASGIMIWTLEDDSTDASTSLLTAIDQTAHETPSH
jgi:chitinase